MVPRPPDRLAPPTMTAEMTRSSAPIPSLGSTALPRAVTMTPAAAASRPISTNAQVRTAGTGMPVSTAAASLLPTK